MRSWRRSALKVVYLVVAWLLVQPEAASAQPKFDAQSPVAVVHEFQSPPLVGPVSIVHLPDNTIYGVAAGGGSKGGGIFKIDASSQFVELAVASEAVGSGTLTPALLTRGLDGNIYVGTPATANSDGAIFRVTPAGVATLLHSFTRSVDGQTPIALLQRPDGTFIGATRSGGSAGSGTLFSMTLDGTTSVIHSFTGQTGIPWTLSISEDGRVFGATLTQNGGVVFAMESDGTLTPLHTFTDFSSPRRIAVLAGTLFVVTQGFSPFPNLSFGTTAMHSLTEAGTLSTLHAFAIDDVPNALMPGSDGRLYGITATGTAFALETNGTYTVLHAFTNDEGAADYTLASAGDAGFVGTARNGGAFGSGTVFTLSLAGSVGVVHTFGGAQYGSFPAELVEDSAGGFVGASGGGVFSRGTLFSMSRSGDVNIIHSATPQEGGSPRSLTIGPSGDIAWLASNGTAFSQGALYRTERDGSTVPVFGTSAGSPVGFFITKAIRRGVGGFIAATLAGPGSVFTIGLDGSSALLHSFTGPEGFLPASILEADDGFVYGTTSLGGPAWFPGFGTVFRLSSTGVLTPLHFFNGADGAVPSGLVLSSDGYLHGYTTAIGSPFTPASGGTIFSIAPDGFFSTLHTFGASENAIPNSLIRGRDGYLYGTTSSGGTFGAGTVFRTAPDGTTIVIHAFSAGDGSSPASLIEASDGNLYGTAKGGGARKGGTVFRIAATDGSVGPAGGTVTDSTQGGAVASITIPPGVVSGQANVSVIVLDTAPQLPTPDGYAGPGTYFVSIEISPTPAFPLSAPGLTLVLPLASPMTPGSPLALFYFDPDAASLLPAIGVDSLHVIGTVNEGGLTATFAGVSHLSTVVGLVPLADTTPPVLTLPADFTVEAANAQGAIVTFTASASDDKDGAVETSCSPESGSRLPLGVTEVQCSARDSRGNAVQGSFEVHVVDTSAPSIEYVEASPSSLWPPNNTLVPVTVDVTAHDAVTPQPACAISDVRSSAEGTGQWRITGALTLELLAARRGWEASRVYTIDVVCVDAAGNRSAKASTNVTVRHDRSSKIR